MGGSSKCWRINRRPSSGLEELTLTVDEKKGAERRCITFKGGREESPSEPRWTPIKTEEARLHA